MTCIFCDIIKDPRSVTTIDESTDALAFFPLNPAMLGHTLVIPKRHVTDYWDASQSDIQPCMEMVSKIGQAIKKSIKPDGLNLVSNAGKAANQTVFHLHFHVLPRRVGDRVHNMWPKEGLNVQPEVINSVAQKIRNSL